jgi:hypothetical protein
MISVPFQIKQKYSFYSDPDPKLRLFTKQIEVLQRQMITEIIGLTYLHGC